MELELTPEGRREAGATAAHVAACWTPAAIYSSPMQRCQATAAEISRACGGVAVSLAPGLNDMDYGAWQWRTHDEVRAEQPERYDLWKSAPQLVRFPGGESLQDVVARTADALREALERHPAQTVVFVTHDAAARGLLLQLLDQPLSAYGRLALDPCGVSEVDIDGGVVSTRRINETGHLRSA